MRTPLPVARVPRALPLVLAGAVFASLIGACGGGSNNAGIVTASSTGFTPRATAPTGTSVPSAPATTPPASGPTTSLGKPTLSVTSAISTVGLDAVHFGMTVAEAEKAAGSPMVTVGASNPSCYVVKPQSGPEGVTFLISDGRVERVDIAAPPIATRSGAKVGSPNAQVRQLYAGQLEDQPRPDGQPGGALVFVPRDEADAKFRLVFLTDGTTVQGYRAGRLPQVLAPTGCGK